MGRAKKAAGNGSGKEGNRNSGGPAGRKPGGRLGKAEAREVRLATLGLLYDKYLADPDHVELSYQDVANLKVAGRPVSPKTARKLIAEMTEVLQRVQPSPRGLAPRPQCYYQLQLAVRVEEKRRIGLFMADRLRPGDTLSLSPGTTNKEAAKALVAQSKYVSILTNNLGVVSELADSELTNLDVTGGLYCRSVHALVGPRAEEAFRASPRMKALVGVSGIRASDGGLFVRHYDEVGVLRAMVESATDEVYILADCTKALEADSWCFAMLDDLVASERPRRVYLVTTSAESITDQEDRARAREALEAIGEKIEVLYAPEESP
jgi:DeoR/GlpR family transcriptional regulator of sugar metabolism